MRRFLQIRPEVYFIGALLLVTVPTAWLLAAVLAAAFHELCHAMTIHLLGGRIYNIEIGLGGTVMETELQGNGKELLAALAGPAGSLLLLLLFRLCPRLAVCAGVQAAFNLLPVYPLDGGRIVRSAWKLVLPGAAAERIADFIGLAVLLIIGILSVFESPKWLILLTLLILMGKKPCNRRKRRVQ